MPVIERPADRGPLFGGKAVIVFGGIDKEAMGRWQEHLRAAEQENADTPPDGDTSASNDAERHDHDDNDGSVDPPSPDTEPHK